MGTKVEIALAKEILSALKKPWYIIPGNHDIGWSELVGVDFISAWRWEHLCFRIKQRKEGLEIQDQGFRARISGG